MATPTIDQFLFEISRIIREKNSAQLQDYLLIEPPFSDLYLRMINELRSTFPLESETRIEEKCSNAIPEARDGEDGSPWTAFIKFMVQYFVFLRDVDVSNLLSTYNLLSELVQKSNSALGHPTLGNIILPAVVGYSHMLARLAIGLDKKPELIAHLTQQASSDEGGARETLPERAANIIRQAFVTCLNDRNSIANRDGRPEGRKQGIYRFANLCLKVLFQCRKTRNAEQIFVNIYNQSPLLSHYPRSQQTTYLYYLGRFLFSNNHFFRAQLALQYAYDICHTKCIKQRRLILIYLVAANTILGRFPSTSLYSRPEAHGLEVRFKPVCEAIAKGDLATFWSLLSPSAAHADWFRHYRILLQLRNRCEVLTWRSLIRKTFLVNGSYGDSNTRKASTFELKDVLVLARMLETRYSAPDKAAGTVGGTPGKRHTNWIFVQSEQPKADIYIDDDFDGAELDGDDQEQKTESATCDMIEVESVISSLVEQELLKGFISHRLLRFAIQGAKVKGPLAAGFPNVWQTIKTRLERNKEQIEVPGWKKAEWKGGPFGGGGGNSSSGVFGASALPKVGPGMVISLNGARPVGAT